MFKVLQLNVLEKSFLQTGNPTGVRESYFNLVYSSNSSGQGDCLCVRVYINIQREGESINLEFLIKGFDFWLLLNVGKPPEKFCEKETSDNSL